MTVFKALAIAGLSISAGGAAHAATTAYTSQSDWLAAIGESPVDYAENFETGYTDNQVMDGVVIGNMTIASSGASIESTAGGIGGSNPIGANALELNDSSGTAVTFSFSNAISYFSLFYIDAGSPNIGGTTFGSTGAAGDTALFGGLIFDIADNVTSLTISSVSGDGRWGVDDMAWGTTAMSAVPLPAGLPLLIGGLGGLAFLRRRKTA